jgi:regulator of RNase E activity RraA
MTRYRSNMGLTLPSCDVSDGLCKLGIAHGGSLPGIGMWSPKRQEGDCRIVGPAYTVKYVAADDDAPKHPTHYVSKSDMFLVV